MLRYSISSAKISTLSRQHNSVAPLSRFCVGCGGGVGVGGGNSVTTRRKSSLPEEDLEEGLHPDETSSSSGRMALESSNNPVPSPLVSLVNPSSSRLTNPVLSNLKPPGFDVNKPVKIVQVNRKPSDQWRSTHANDLPQHPLQSLRKRLDLPLPNRQPLQEKSFQHVHKLPSSPQYHQTPTFPEQRPSFSQQRITPLTSQHQTSSFPQQRLTPSVAQQRQSPSIGVQPQTSTFAQHRQGPSFSHQQQTPSFAQHRQSPFISEPQQMPSLAQRRQSPFLSQEHQTSSLAQNPQRTSITLQERTSSFAQSRHVPSLSQELQTSSLSQERQTTSFAQHRQAASTAHQPQTTSISQQRQSPSFSLQPKTSSVSQQHQSPAFASSQPQRSSFAQQHQTPLVSQQQLTPSFSQRGQSPLVSQQQRSPAFSQHRQSPLISQQQLSFGRQSQALSYRQNERLNSVSWSDRLQKYTNSQEPWRYSAATANNVNVSNSSAQENTTFKWRKSSAGIMGADSAEKPITDMRDVSLLRAALLKCAERQKQQPTEPMFPPGNLKSSTQSKQKASAADSLWRSPKEHQQQNSNLTWRIDQADTEHGGRPTGTKHTSQPPMFPGVSPGARTDRKATPTAFFNDKEADEVKRKWKRSYQEEHDAVEGSRVLLPPAPVSVAALSFIFRVKVGRIMRKLRECGENPTDEDFIVDVDTMEIVAFELGLEPVRSNRRVVQSVMDEHRNLLLQRRVDDAYNTDEFVDSDGLQAHETLQLRPPVVCIMGHVDHGKTTLMDALRRKKSAIYATDKQKKKKSKNKAEGKKVSDDVAGTEAGGITQVISAFQVALPNQDDSLGAVTFLDTPGHAAFRAMRESGSHAADVIVLVVAADDGVSKQTIEIIDFFKSIYKESGGISLMVAMTKIDKPGIIVDECRYRIENELLEHGIVTESFASTSTNEYGPPVQLVPVSGMTGEGLDELIDALVLQSEVMELRADPKAQAEGIVLDAKMERGVGVVVDCIVRWGSMERGDVVLCGLHTGRVKALKNVKGENIDAALPSQPVRIIGFRSIPKAGDPIICVESEEKAEMLIERRTALGRPDEHVRSEDESPSTLQIMGVNAQHRKLESIHEKYNIDINSPATSLRIPVLLKADADGTLTALREAIIAIGDESSLDIVIDPIATGVGPVTSGDVKMAKDSDAAIFSFNVKQNDKEVIALMDSLGVVFKSHNIIYSLIDAAKDVVATYLPRTQITHIHGEAEVKAVFEITNKGKEQERIAGLRVKQGKIFFDKASVQGTLLDCHYRVIRKGEQISPDGTGIAASSLRKVKEDVKEVRNGEECGLGLSGFQDFEEGDVIECYSVESKAHFV